MKFDPRIHHRRSIRLKGYDYYQPGAYFITVVAQARECLFGAIENGEMRLNAAGRIAHDAWRDLPRHYPHVELGTFCIMPNHVHGIIILTDDGRGGSAEGQDGVQDERVDNAGRLAIRHETRPNVRHALPEIVRAFKSFSARRINVLRGSEGLAVWQRDYYEHVIRNDQEHNRIHLYIQANAENWVMDDENPVKER